MIIKMLTGLSGKGFSYSPDETVEVTSRYGQKLITAGYAEFVSDDGDSGGAVRESKGPAQDELQEIKTQAAEKTNTKALIPNEKTKGKKVTKAKGRRKGKARKFLTGLLGKSGKN